MGVCRHLLLEKVRVSLQQDAGQVAEPFDELGE